MYQRAAIHTYGKMQLADQLGPAITQYIAGACGQQYGETGDISDLRAQAARTYAIELGSNQGLVNFNWEASADTVRFILRYEGDIIREWPCSYGNVGSFEYGLDGASTVITVEVLPCSLGPSGGPGEWSFTLYCPGPA